MKILLINNNTVHLKQLTKALTGHDIEIQKYQPGLDFHHHGKDLVILSGGGGEGLEIDDISHQGKLWYEDEMSFVRSCPVPVIGICMGFEVMAKAYGQAVPNMNRHISATEVITMTEKGWQMFDKHSVEQVESHGWHVPEAPQGFEVLAQSEHGVEMMMAPNRLGAQFHPELGGTLNIKNLVSALSHI